MNATIAALFFAWDVPGTPEQQQQQQVSSQPAQLQFGQKGEERMLMYGKSRTVQYVSNMNYFFVVA